MATCTTLDLLNTSDGDVKCSGEDCYMEPGQLDEQRHRGASSARELFVVQGETTGTSMSRSKVSKKVRRPISASSARAKGNQSADAGVAEDGVAAAVRSKEESHDVGNDSMLEVRALREQLEQCRRELAHTREEREELQVAFRRLDQEVTNGYNLTERKEKEMKIAELLAKNQKISQMLEKELKNQETLRVANADLQAQVQRLDQQTVLLNRVLTNLETKHNALSEAHCQLTATHAAAQRLNVDLQAQIMQWEAESASQRGVNYEEKLRVCEAKCSELQRELDDKHALLRAEQDKNKALERTCEKLLEEKAALESEVAGVHDKMIRMNGAMKAMEACVETSSGNAHGASILERVKERVKVLEEDVLVKNRLIGDLKETVNGLLSGEPVSQSRKGLKRRFPGATSTGARNDVASSRLATAIQRLRKAEESRYRDHKSRCLNVLLAILPQLLQQLDALQDKFYAVAESNTILSNAVDQLQSSAQDGELRSCGPPIALAREGYLLSGPYQPELLMGFTMSRALSEVSPAPPRKQAKFMPFHVRTRANITDNSSNQGELSLVADADDASGVAFLNRCKINAFLHFVQGSAAKTKCKQLLVQKIADLISTQRDLLHMHSTESGFYRASVAKLEAEVRQRARQHAELQHQVERLQSAVGVTSSGPMSRHMKLLLRLVHAVTGAVSRRNTFLTQTEGYDSSDVLISERDDAASRCAYSRSEILLDLSDCDVGDEDLEALLLKISVSPVRVHQLDLSDNWITDDGAATIAAFIGTCPCSLKILDLRGNTRISSEGVGRLQNGALKNPRACRVEVDSARNTLFVFSAGQEYDTAGRPPILLQIHLPDQRPSGDHDQDKSVEQMIHRLDSLGFSGSGANWNQTEAAYRPKRASTSVTKSSAGRPRLVPSKESSSTSARVVRTAFHDKKSRALEMALRRADSPATARTSAGDAKRGISLSQIQYLLKSHASRSTTTPTKASATMSSHRLAKLQFAQSHLATIRGLGKR